MLKKIKDMLSSLVSWPGRWLKKDSNNAEQVSDIHKHAKQVDLVELAGRGDKLREIYQAKNPVAEKESAIVCSKCGKAGNEDDFYCDALSNKYYCEECWNQL